MPVWLLVDLVVESGRVFWRMEFRIHQLQQNNQLIKQPALKRNWSCWIWFNKFKLNSEWIPKLIADVSNELPEWITEFAVSNLFESIQLQLQPCHVWINRSISAFLFLELKPEIKTCRNQFIWAANKQIKAKVLINGNQWKESRNGDWSNYLSLRV